jgi:UDP-N-acetylglucosamine 2-epimerase
MKILTVVGARPQFIKAGPVSREIRKIHEEILVHTGQHYDKNMSDIFFEELNIPKPNYNLGIGSGSHGRQTGEMLIGIEEILFKEKPDMVLVYGDTNSTLAGALSASKLHIPIAHVEAGLRSYNMLMPEEQNRILTDHISNLLLCPTENAVKTLAKENVIRGVYNVGDVMYDSVLYNIDVANRKMGFDTCLESIKNCEDINIQSGPDKIHIKSGKYILTTIHRAENTDNLDNLEVIIDSLNSAPYPVIFPVHPRTRKFINHVLELLSIKNSNILFIEPVGYLQMLILTENAKKVVTDSGGLQKEAYFLKTPCVTLRNETEWVETLGEGWNRLCSIEKKGIIESISSEFNRDSAEQKMYFGDGKASQKIADIISETNI